MNFLLQKKEGKNHTKIYNIEFCLCLAHGVYELITSVFYVQEIFSTSNYY